MTKKVVTLEGKEVINTSELNGDDQFYEQLHDKMRTKESVQESLDVALEHLIARGYSTPRIYRKKENDCVLIKCKYLPSKIFHQNKKTTFTVKNPILEEIITNSEIYHNLNFRKYPDLNLGEKDPLNYVPKECCALLGIPYEGKSQIIQNKEIKGAIILNYNPSIMQVDLEEIGLLYRIGKNIGDKVTELLVLNYLKGKQKEIEKKKRELELQVKIDGPTGLFNKKTFHEDIEIYVKKARDNNTNYCLIMMDFDKFKTINDIYGHAAGDKVIEQIGKMINKLSPKRGYRIGGDEFAIILECNNINDALILGEKIRTETRNIKIPENSKISTSIGINSLNKENSSGEQWYKETDKFLYQAKEKRDTIVFNTLEI